MSWLGKSNTDYMLFTVPVKENLRKNYKLESDSNQSFEELVSKERSTIPAVTHVDYSARLQTLVENTPQSIQEFFEQLIEGTGQKVFINTSFNVRGEPIVDSPEDAFSAFMRTDLDFLYINGILL